MNFTTTTRLHGLTRDEIFVHLIDSCISSMRVSKMDKVFGVSDLACEAVVGHVVVSSRFLGGDLFFCWKHHEEGIHSNLECTGMYTPQMTRVKYYVHLCPLK